jgi:hypothetical protein
MKTGTMHAPALLRRPTSAAISDHRSTMGDAPDVSK